MTNSTPAGWYPNTAPNAIPHTEMYYDGTQWLPELVRAAGAPAEAVTATIATQPEPKPEPKRPWYKRKAIIIPAAVVGGIIILSGIVSSGGDDDTAPVAERTASATEEVEPEVVEVVTVEVPDTSNMTFADAAAAFAAAGLTTGDLAGKEGWIVSSTSPAAGDDVEPGTLIILLGEEPKPVYTVSQQAALDSANSYMRNLGGFSRQGLIDQLMYEQFSIEDATFAADTGGYDWMQSAADSAASYMKNLGGFSRGSLIDQLLFEGFTQAEAEYGVTSVGL